jgi:hypothetical protein
MNARQFLSSLLLIALFCGAALFFLWWLLLGPA